MCTYCTYQQMICIHIYIYIFYICVLISVYRHIYVYITCGCVFGCVCSICISCIGLCIVASHSVANRQTLMFKASAEGALRALPVEAQRQARSGPKEIQLVRMIYVMVVTVTDVQPTVVLVSWKYYYSILCCPLTVFSMFFSLSHFFGYCIWNQNFNVLYLSSTMRHHVVPFV